MWGYMVHLAIRHQLNLGCSHINCPKKCWQSTDYNKVIEFKEKISQKVNNEILYFPTYRRIEEDMSNLGIDIERDRLKNRLIQFGMSDVEKILRNFWQQLSR